MRRHVCPRRRECDDAVLGASSTRGFTCDVEQMQCSKATTPLSGILEMRNLLNPRISFLVQ